MFGGIVSTSERGVLRLGCALAARGGENRAARVCPRILAQDDTSEQ